MRSVGAGGRDGWFVRAAEVVGDLSNPFSQEERQRDVWNEASAVGLQLVLWLGLALAAAMVWLGGSTGLPYACAVFALVGVVSWVSVGYAAALGVQVGAGQRVLRPRLVPYVLLVGVFLLGALRAAPDGGLGRGVVVGAAAGALAAVVALVVKGARTRSGDAVA